MRRRRTEEYGRFVPERDPRPVVAAPPGSRPVKPRERREGAETEKRKEKREAERQSRRAAKEPWVEVRSATGSHPSSRYGEEGEETRGGVGGRGVPRPEAAPDPARPPKDSASRTSTPSPSSPPGRPPGPGPKRPMGTRSTPKVVRPAHTRLRGPGRRGEQARNSDRSAKNRGRGRATAESLKLTLRRRPSPAVSVRRSFRPHPRSFPWASRGPPEPAGGGAPRRAPDDETFRRRRGRPKPNVPVHSAGGVRGYKDIT